MGVPKKSLPAFIRKKKYFRPVSLNIVPQEEAPGCSVNFSYQPKVRTGTHSLAIDWIALNLIIILVEVIISGLLFQKNKDPAKHNFYGIFFSYFY